MNTLIYQFDLEYQVIHLHLHQLEHYDGSSPELITNIYHPLSKRVDLSDPIGQLYYFYPISIDRLIKVVMLVLMLLNQYTYYFALNGHIKPEDFLCIHLD